MLALFISTCVLTCVCHFSVYEKEKLRGRDPLAPDDVPFGEYTAGYARTYYCIHISVA